MKKRSDASAINYLLLVPGVGFILLFIGCCAAFVRTANWRPFIPPHDPATGAFGWSGILRGSAVVF